MNFRFVVILLASVLFLNGCGTTDPTETLVKSYIAEAQAVDVKTIKILELEKAEPWLAADSLQVLSEELSEKKEEVLGHLKAAIEASTKAIEQAEQVTISGFPALAEVAEQTILESKETIALAEEKIEQIQNNPEGTVLEAMNKRIEQLKTMENNVLFQVLKGKWSGSDGVEHDFNLMADQDLSRVIGKIGN